MPSGAITKYETKILAQKVNNSSAVLLRQKTGWHRNIFLNSAVCNKSKEAIGLFACICINKPKSALHVKKAKKQTNKTTNKQAKTNKPSWISKIFPRFFLAASTCLTVTWSQSIFHHFAHHSRCAASGTGLSSVWKWTQIWRHEQLLSCPTTIVCLLHTKIFARVNWQYFIRGMGCRDSKTNQKCPCTSLCYFCPAPPLRRWCLYSHPPSAGTDSICHFKYRWMYCLLLLSKWKMLQSTLRNCPWLAIPSPEWHWEAAPPSAPTPDVKSGLDYKLFM